MKLFRRILTLLMISSLIQPAVADASRPFMPVASSASQSLFITQAFVGVLTWMKNPLKSWKDRRRPSMVTTGLRKEAASLIPLDGPHLISDGVFEGGGVKGIGLVGAASVMEEMGYRWGNLAGTSAGSIVAVLLGAGYTAKELLAIMQELDYMRFKDPTQFTRIPLIGTPLSVLFDLGIYKGDYFLHWIADLLEAKGVKTFGDLQIPGQTDPRYRYKVSVITSDLTNGRMVMLPSGAEWYKVDPDRLSVAWAVRMSMSIPFFFTPVKFRRRLFVDGGMLNNLPVSIFDTPGTTVPEWPTFGFTFIDPSANQPAKTQNVLQYTRAILRTLLEAHDKRNIEELDWPRTIGIPTLGVSTIEFGITKERQLELFEAGAQAAREFLRGWDWQAHIAERLSPDPVYQRRLGYLRTKMIIDGRTPDLPKEVSLKVFLPWLLLPLGTLYFREYLDFSLAVLAPAVLLKAA